MDTYRNLAESHIEEVFRIMDWCCIQCGISYFLIGAQARDIHILEGGLKPIRHTLDIDFAVMVPEYETYNQFKKQLLSKGFTEDKVPYRLIFEKSDTIIDLLPFGEVEEKRTVNFDSREIELSVLGLQEVSEQVIDYELNTITIKVSPLEGIFLLKLISNSENPSRTKDLDDIQQIITSYFELNRDRIYEQNWNHIAQIEDNHFILLAGAKILGVDLKKILEKSVELKSTVTAIIEKELSTSPATISSYFLSKNAFESLEIIQRIFAQIKEGIDS